MQQRDPHAIELLRRAKMCYEPLKPTAALPAMAGSVESPFAFLPETMPALANAALKKQGGNVVVRSVWAHNMREEVELIESLMASFRYAAVDTEFPGTVHRSETPAYLLTAEEKYALIKANVDELHPIQLGLTLFDAAGTLPDLGTGGATRYVWEFNFREFDLRCHRHAPESVALLQTKAGLDFSRTSRDGVDASVFGPRLRKLVLRGLGGAGVVTFSGAYDLGYLMKMMFGGGYKLPAMAAEFEAVVKAMFRWKLYDVKEMARHCPAGVDLRGGLEIVAAKLSVPQAVGEAHQAGSDSLLTCQTFMKMKECYFDDGDKLTTVVGVVTGINAA